MKQSICFFLLFFLSLVFFVESGLIRVGENICSDAWDIPHRIESDKLHITTTYFHRNGEMKKRPCKAFFGIFDLARYFGSKQMYFFKEDLLWTCLVFAMEQSIYNGSERVLPQKIFSLFSLALEPRCDGEQIRPCGIQHIRIRRKWRTMGNIFRGFEKSSMCRTKWRQLFVGLQIIRDDYGWKHYTKLFGSKKLLFFKVR